MPKTRPPWASEVRRQMVDLVRAGRDPAGLAGEFGPSAQAIRDWAAQADRNEGCREERSEVLTVAEREDLARLRREVRRPRGDARHPLESRGSGLARETGPGSGAVPSGSSKS